MARRLGTDVLGVGLLALDGMFGLTDIVESMHGTIARRPLPFGGRAERRTRGITRFVYQSIRGVTRLVDAGVHVAAPLLSRASGPDLPARGVIVSALNGVLGDHLAATANPLAIEMEVLPSEAAPSPRVVLFVHGLCMNPTQWLRRGHHHGEALARALGVTPLVLHYNSGRHISTNGRELAEHLEKLVATWPVPLEQLAIVGHSMGGLVTRSAVHHAQLAGHRWVERLTHLVFLGTPHHGAPLERAGNVFEGLLELSPYVAPLARLGTGRSAGITDLRFGNLLDEDWSSQERNHRHDPRTPVPLPDGVACFAVAATKGRQTGDLPDRLVGDGLVPVASALGHHPDPRFQLAFPADHQRVMYQCGHFDLIDSPAVFDALAAWLR